MKKILFVLLSISSLVLVSCNAQIEAPAESDELTSESSEVTASNQLEEGVISVSGDEFSFSPSSLEVKSGETVKISFKNEGESYHNLVITDLGVESDVIGPGEVDYFEFVPDKSGTFEMICSIAGHKEAGMKGSITIK